MTEEGCFNANSYDRTAWFALTEKGEALLADCGERRFALQPADGRWTKKDLDKQNKLSKIIFDKTKRRKDYEHL